jgi:carbonic anhydrase
MSIYAVFLRVGHLLVRLHGITITVNSHGDCDAVKAHHKIPHTQKDSLDRDIDRARGRDRDRGTHLHGDCAAVKAHQTISDTQKDSIDRHSRITDNLSLSLHVTTHSWSYYCNSPL